MDPISVSASVAGILSLTITIASGLDSIVSAYRETSRHVFDLVLELACLRKCLENIRNSIPGLANVDIPDEPTFTPLLLCMETLLELQEHIPDSQERMILKGETTITTHPTGKPKISVWEKIKWIRNKSKIQEYLNRLESHKTTLIMYICENQFNHLKESLEKYESLNENQDKEASKRFDEWKKNDQSVKMCSYFVPATPYPYDHLQKAQSLRHATTGLWFVRGQPFLQWSNSEEGKLWVHGIPGAGKTILASLAITTERRSALRNRNIGVAYYFCDYKFPKTLEVRAILGALLFQLSMQNTSAMELLLDFHTKVARNYSSLDAVPPEDLCQQFGQIANCFEEVSLIVDGLDECEDTEQVTRYLAGLSSPANRVRSLFFSRDLQQIEKILSKQKFRGTSVAANNGDIKSYVDSEVEKRIEDGELQVEDENLKTKIRETLMQGSQGM